MIVIRRSHLEDFRRVVDTDWGDEDELVRKISGNPDPPNWKMEAGTAWHKVLEGSHAPEDDCALYDFDADTWHYGGWSFAGAAAEQGVKLFGPGLRELKAARRYDTPRGPVLLECTADHIRGLRIADAKTKFDAPDPRSYEDVLQWRCYLSVFGAERFTYHLFHFRPPPGADGDENCDAGGHCELKDVLSVPFYRYRGIDAEVADWCGRFREWAEARRLLPYLAPGRRAVA